MKKNILSIVIPTYNRSELLDISLCNLISTVRKFNIEIIVSDNASTDNTESVVRSRINDYSELKYFRQPTNVGYDRNVMNCYNYASTDYIWILGDAYQIVKEQLENVICKLDEGVYQGIVMNALNRIQNIPSKIYNDPSNLLSDLGWHMTLLNSFVISKEFTKNIACERYYNTYFFHLGVFFENIVLYDNLQICWIEENLILHTKFDENLGDLRKGGWFDKIFEVFGTHWFCLIMSLPNQISIDAKLKCIKDHDENTHIFAFKKLIRLRANDVIYRKDFDDNKVFVPFFTDVSMKKLEMVFYIPVFILKLMKLVNTIAKKLRNDF